MSEHLGFGVRVVLDLTSFFQDKRKKSYFYIDFSQNPIIRDVHRGIVSSFDITQDVMLELNGCHVPDNIDARVLYNEDVIKVIEACEESPEDHKFCEQSEKNIDYKDACDEPISKKKRKYRNWELKGDNDDEIGNGSKRKEKRKSRNCDVKEENGNCSVNFEDCEKPVKERGNVSKLNSVMYVESKPHAENLKNVHSNVSNDSAVLNGMKKNLPNLKAGPSDRQEEVEMMKSASEVIKTENGNTENPNTVEFSHVQTLVLDPKIFATKTVNICEATLTENSVLEDHSNARQVEVQNEKEMDQFECHDSVKKRRRRRRKKCSKDNELTSDHNYSVQSLNVSSILLNETRKTPKHIKFVDDDLDDDNNEDVKDNISNKYDNCNGNIEISDNVSTNIIGKSALTKTDQVNGWKNKDNFQSKEESAMYTGPSSSCVDNSELICGNIIPRGSPTPLIFECKKASKPSNIQSPKTENEVNFLKYPLLRGFPKVNDIIAFKKWKMDTNYCPGISEYISAKVIKLSEEDSTIHLKILNGHEEFKEPQGKFFLSSQENGEEGEEPEETVPDYVHMNIKDLFDIRLIYP